MPKRIDPLTRLWHGSLLLLGSVVALSLMLQLLATIWPWLVLLGVIGLAVIALGLWLRARRNSW